jgi:hypothetical protein
MIRYNTDFWSFANTPKSFLIHQKEITSMHIKKILNWNAKRNKLDCISNE